jgi:hypothetical protein
LKSQTAEKLTLVHAHITVTSIEEFYEESSICRAAVFMGIIGIHGGGVFFNVNLDGTSV